MNVLLLPYILNIMILVPFGIGTLFNLFPVSRGYFPESEGWRSLVGSLWVAILAGSVLGLVNPVVLSPVLLIQVIYKILWLLVYVVPRIANVERRKEVPWILTSSFALIIVFYSMVIPWNYILGNS